MGGVTIHPSAVVERGAELADGVEVGPFTVVEAGARVGRGTKLLAHVVVHGRAALGEGNVVFPFAVIGGSPQAKRAQEGASRVVVGSWNLVREHVTIHAGTEGRETTVGDHNLFMVGAHVAHDVRVGCHAVLANGVQLAGHAVVEDWATFGGLSGVAQFVRVGESAFVAAGAMCEADVPPFVIVQGDRARVRALNVVGLRRRGVPESSIEALGCAFRALYARKRPITESVRALAGESDPFVAKLRSALIR